MRLVPLVLLVGLAALAIAGTSRAQQPQLPRTHDFVVTAGTDTIATERYTRTTARVESDLVIAAQGIRFGFAMTLAPDGTVRRLETAVSRTDASATSAPSPAAVLEFAHDSVLVTMGTAATPAQRFAVPAGTLPFINLSAAIAEQILLRARAIGGTTAEIPLFNVSGAQQFRATVRWLGADSAVITFPNSDLHASVTHDGHFLGGTVPSQGVYFSQAGSAPAPPVSSASPTRHTTPDYSAPPGAPYTAEDVRVHNAKANLDLAGTLTMPHHAAGQRMPAVVMITGSGAEDRDEATPALPGWRPFRQIADTLGRRGIAVLRLDDRGVGASDAGPAGATSEDFAGDIRAALAYLRTRADVDPERLALIGHSEGATMALMVGAEDSALHAIVLLAGASRTGRAVSDQQVRAAIQQRLGLSGASLDSAVRANDVARDAQVAASPWLHFWFDYDPLATAKRLRMPVLIVQGATDTQVSPDQAEELSAAIRSGGNRDVTVRLMSETNHLLVHDPDGAFTRYGTLPSLSVTPAVLGTIADWLVAHMR